MLCSSGLLLSVVLQTILHGSPEAKKAGELDMQQHSKLIARGKYIHAFESESPYPRRFSPRRQLVTASKSPQIVDSYQQNIRSIQII